MGYSVKWITENMGITRDMLRYYEKEKLLSVKESRNVINNYREYNDEDLEKIWSIKLLIGIGFSAKEIYALMNDDDFDFDAAMTKKVAELEAKCAEATAYLEFAKSIKLIGKVPTVSKMGSMRFDDFMEHVREHWNFYSDPQAAPYLRLAEEVISKDKTEFEPEELERILELLGAFDAEEMKHTYILNGYYQIIADMQELEYSSDTVQRVVRLLHEYLVCHNEESELDGKITPQFFAKYTATSFLYGDVAVMHERSYGEDGCNFIAQAIAFYGGYDIQDL